jgi:hypothetical protein
MPRNNLRHSAAQFFACIILPAAFCFLLTACQGQSEEKPASAAALTAPLSTQSPAASPSVDPRITDLERVREGKAAPDFALEDINGNLIRLSDYQGKKNVILVFYRGHF